MIHALRTIIEGTGVEDDWARERVKNLLSGVAPAPRVQAGMTVDMGGVAVTVTGARMALVLVPESSAAPGGGEPEEE